MIDGLKAFYADKCFMGWCLDAIKSDPCKKDATPAPAPAPTPAPCTDTWGEPIYKGGNSCDSQNNNCGCQQDGGDCCGVKFLTEGDGQNDQHCKPNCKCFISKQKKWTLKQFLQDMTSNVVICNLKKWGFEKISDWLAWVYLCFEFVVDLSSLFQFNFQKIIYYHPQLDFFKFFFNKKKFKIHKKVAIFAK